MNQVQTTRPVTQGLLPEEMQAQFNSQYANAVALGDPRFQLKQLDRPGLSRGAGQNYQAGITASQAMADGIANAYSQQLQNRQYNANTQLQAENQQEQNAQQLAGFQAQQRYAEQMARMQMMGSMFGLLGGLLK